MQKQDTGSSFKISLNSIFVQTFYASLVNFFEQEEAKHLA